VVEDDTYRNPEMAVPYRPAGKYNTLRNAVMYYSGPSTPSVLEIYSEDKIFAVFEVALDNSG
jgi:hypothetical protein